MIRERCSCGAEIETDDNDSLRIVVKWRKGHKCLPQVDDRVTSGFAQVEIAPDYTVPDLHLGFRAFPDET